MQGEFKEAYEAYIRFTGLKDSIFNDDKSKEIGKLEAKYEFEKAEEEKKSLERKELERSQFEESRRNNLQYSGIFMVIVALGMSLFTLGKFNLSVRLVEGIIFFTFLLFFEFTLVLLDPFIEQYSGGEPAFKLLFNAVLAAMIFPLHSFFENNVKKRLAKA